MSLGYLLTHSFILLFCFARILAFFSVLPMMSSAGGPYQVRAGLAFLTSVVILPMVTALDFYPVPESLPVFLFLILSEIVIGLMMGFVVYGYFVIFQMAGQLFTIQMGLSASEAFDPMSQEEMPLIGNFFNLASLYLFVSTKGFVNLFLGGIYESFRRLPAPDFMLVRQDALDFFLKFTDMLMRQSFVIALPIIGTLLLASLTMGLLAKAAPQMNLLMLGFPVNITVAFVLIILCLPVMIDFFSYLFDRLFTDIGTVFYKGGLNAISQAG